MMKFLFDMPLQFEARKIAMKQDRTGFVLTLVIHPDELPDELIRDFVGSRYMCALVRLQDDESQTDYKNRVSMAGILCRNHVFQEFMEQHGGAQSLSEEETAQYLCKICVIESRTELNGNQAAKKLFDELVSKFEEWKINGSAF